MYIYHCKFTVLVDLYILSHKIPTFLCYITGKKIDEGRLQICWGHSGHKNVLDFVNWKCFEKYFPFFVKYTPQYERKFAKNSFWIRNDFPPPFRESSKIIPPVMGRLPKEMRKIMIPNEEGGRWWWLWRLVIPLSKWDQGVLYYTVLHWI